MQLVQYKLPPRRAGHKSCHAGRHYI